jgi:hypothetical protein
MQKHILLPAALAALALCLSSCNDKEADPNAGVIKFSPAEVAKLLGIKEESGLTVGEVVSGREGIKVKSISLKPPQGAELEVEDIEMRIVSTGKLVYTMSYLSIGKLDVLDWKTSQRVKATGIRVDEPGEGFLTKLQDAISSAKGGSSFRTAELICAKLSVDGIEYEIRDKDGKNTRVNFEGLVIADAKCETLGAVSLGKVDVGGAVNLSGFKVTGVDRAWVDLIIETASNAMAATEKAKATIATGGKPPEQAPRKPSGKLVSFDRYDIGGIDKLLPFNHLEAGKMAIGLNNVTTKDNALVIQGIRLDIQRDAAGKFAGLSGEVGASILTKELWTEAGKFLGDMGNPKLLTSVSATLKLGLTLDKSRNLEKPEISFTIPGLGSVSLSGSTRGLPQVLGMIMTLGDKAPDQLVGISSGKLEYHDDGLVAFLVSNRFKDSERFRKGLTDTIDGLGSDYNGGAGLDLLRAQMTAFLESPGAAVLGIETEQFYDLDGYIFKTLVSNNNELHAKRTLSLSRK